MSWAAELAGETGIEIGIVKKVLAAQERILEKMGVVEVVEEETTEDDNPQETDSETQEEHTAQESHKPEGSASDFLEERVPGDVGAASGRGYPHGYYGVRAAGGGCRSGEEI